MVLQKDTYMIPRDTLETVLSILQTNREELDTNGTAALNALEDEIMLQEAARNLFARMADRRRRELTMEYL